MTIRLEFLLETNNWDIVPGKKRRNKEQNAIIKYLLRYMNCRFFSEDIIY